MNTLVLQKVGWKNVSSTLTYNHMLAGVAKTSFLFSAPKIKMSNFLILSWAGQLTQTK